MSAFWEINSYRPASSIILKRRTPNQPWVLWTTTDDASEVLKAAKNFNLYVIAAKQAAMSLGPSSPEVQYPVPLGSFLTPAVA
jgi:hypothetical protein